ncbi:hypothetical protein [Streptomyces sp. Wb2n-11]|uniref:hypothetical protein n=1 Tax=Streptomyces sp. Wb2n-11 TaxID=1030533 RepID=UPI001146B8FF|nr:hypothetical protein [Streptomyces sp. Wb2n-11]
MAPVFRRLVAAAVTAALAVALPLLAAGPAQAAALVACTGTADQQYSPGLTLAQQTVQWNNGDTSTPHATSIPVRTLGQTVVVSSGTITAGRYTGATFVQTVTFATPLNQSLACLTPTGVTSVSGMLTLTITSL